MKRFYGKVIQFRKIIMLAFLLLAVLCAYSKQFISVNYDMNDYLPDDTPSTVALDVMDDEFDGEIPNARVMVKNVTIAQALDYKERLEKIGGVSSVTWLDDNVPITIPLEMMDQDTVNTYYKDNQNRPINWNRNIITAWCCLSKYRMKEKKPTHSLKTSEKLLKNIIRTPIIWREPVSAPMT